MFGGWFGRREQREDRDARRLPPGQTLTSRWPVLHYGPVPRFDRARWNFRTHGLVENPIQVNFDEFLKLPRVEVTNDIHCVTHWSKYDNHWEGVSFQTIVEMTKPLPEAKFVIAHGEHGFTANLPLSELRRDDVLLALKHDGQDLTPDHGYPLRLVVPHLYFWKSAKWLRALEFVAEDELGFWEVRGYHNHADPWKEERYG